MKKLLIAMTAAAVGTCAWATEGAGGTTPNYLNEDFSEWSLTAPWSYGTIKDGVFSALDAAGDGELTLADGKLSLNTGSKILRGALANSAVTIPDAGLFIESKVTFKDPSDTVPDLGTDGKFALFVLDNVESCETYNTKDNPNVVDPSTNLWALGGYAVTVDGNRTLETRAYKLKVLQKTQDLEQEIDSTWLAREHTVAIKAYNDVLDGAAVNGGFMVLVDGKLCSVTEVHKVVNGVISYAEGDWFYTQTVADYLGDANAAIDSTLSDRYTAANLILNKKPAAQQLASVDFQGQGVIDDVRVTEEDVGFGSDATVLSVYTDGGIASVKVGTKEITLDETNFDGKYNVADADWVGDETKTLTVTFVVNSDFLLKDADNYTKTENANEYIATITKATGTKKYTLSLDTYLPKVSVEIDGETKKFASLSDAIDEVGAGAELTLTDAITLTEAIEVTENITINLNGKTLSATLTDEFASMFTLADGVTLTITDTTGGVLEITGEDGRLIAKGPERATSGATVAINAGTIKADIANENAIITYALTGGQYDTDVSAVLVGNYVATKAEGSEYWTVAEKVVVKYTVTFNVDGNTTAIAAQTVAENGTATAPAAPIKNGYTFAGWKLNDAAYDFATAVTGDITLVATWTAIEYAITYAWNGLEAGANPVNSNPATYTIEDGITFAEATCDGYTFKGFSPATITVGSTGGITVTGTFEKNAPAVTPVEPGAATGTEYDSEDAANAAAAKTEVAVPDAVAKELNSDQQSAYKALFEVTTKQVGNNKWVVSVELTETATATLQEAVETAVKALPVATVAALTTGDAAAVNVDATPGLYYSVESGTSLGAMVEGDRTLATGDKVNLELKKQGNSGFYRIKVSVKGK